MAKDSIVREIWGKADTILFIFAGASAEFALSKAVDWLYFTGRLPADPLGRLFSTVSYAREIVFSNSKSALHAIDTMTAIHAGVEARRGSTIPAWAYRDVLFMLIDYSIRSFELLERKLTRAEKREVFQVFYRVGSRMGIEGLPQRYEAWLNMRHEHLQANLQESSYTADLYRQYRKHLGFMRYRLLLEGQKLLVPDQVRSLLCFSKASLLRPVLPLYKVSRHFNLDWLLKEMLLPTAYLSKLKGLDSMSA